MFCHFLSFFVIVHDFAAIMVENVKMMDIVCHFAAILFENVRHLRWAFARPRRLRVRWLEGEGGDVCGAGLPGAWGELSTGSEAFLWVPSGRQSPPSEFQLVPCG